MNIIIHVGLTKTGSTAIQYFLDKNSDKLVDLGYYYPKFEDVDSQNYRTSGNGHGLCLEVLAKSINPKILKKTIVDWISRQAEYARTKNCSNLIISSEAFCMLPENDFKMFLSFLPRDTFKYNFILFNREPYAWFFSSWLQGVKRGGKGKWLDSSLIEDLDFALRPLLAEAIIKSSELKNSLHVLNYELCKKNVIDEFICAIGIDSEKHTYLDLDAGKTKTNRSISESEFLFFFWANKYSNGNVELSEELHSLISDSASSEDFFFVSPKARDIIYNYCDSQGISYSKIDYKSKEISSEEMYVASLTSKDRVYLDTLRIIISFYSRILQKARGLTIHKIKLYSSSEYKNLVPEDFDPFVYLILNDDVLFSHIDPYKHYHEYGASEKRLYSLNITQNSSSTASVKRKWLSKILNKE